TWCKDEHEVALNERRNDDEFVLFAARPDDCEIPTWFKNAIVCDVRAGRAQPHAEFLRSLSCQSAVADGCQTRCLSCGAMEPAHGCESRGHMLPVYARMAIGGRFSTRQMQVTAA